MLLSPEAVETLNAHCVVYTVNVLPSDLASRRLQAQRRAWAERNAPALSPLLQERVDIGPYLLAPDGTVLKQVQRPEDVVADVKTAAAQAGVRPAAPVARASLAWFSNWKPGDLGLKLTVRFVPAPDARLPQPAPWQVPIVCAVGTAEQNERMYKARLGSPTRDGVVLLPETVRGLLPPDPAAREWDVPAEVATELLWLFRPSTHQYQLRRDDVREVSLRATADGAERALLEGRVKVRHWWFPRSAEGLWLGDRLAEDYWADAPVRGYLDFAGGKVKALRLVSDGAVYRGRDGASLPFEAALYSVDPAEAAACTVKDPATGSAGGPSPPPR